MTRSMTDPTPAAINVAMQPGEILRTTGQALIQIGTCLPNKNTLSILGTGPGHPAPNH